MGKQKDIEDQMDYCTKMMKRLAVDVHNAKFDGYGAGKHVVANGIRNLRRELLRMQKMIDGNNE